MFCLGLLTQNAVVLAQDTANTEATAAKQDVSANQSAASNESASATEPKSLKQEYAENYVFDDPSKRKAFLELTAVLRCPKCQNQNIADSDAPISHDMRRKTYQLMQEGKDKSEVIAWMKERYGDFVYYQPPVNVFTIWLWLLPILFTGVMAIFFIRRRKPAVEQNVEAKLAQADQMLKDD
jgi:cytochrome c-type biogenesis protein CcmH